MPPIPPPMMASLILPEVDEQVEVPSGTGKVTGSSETDATAEMPLGIGDADEVPFRSVVPLGADWPFVRESPFGTDVPLEIEWPFVIGVPVGTESPLGIGAKSAPLVPFETGAVSARDATSGTEATAWTGATSAAEDMVDVGRRKP